MKLLQCYIDNIITTALMEDINYIDAAADNLIPEEHTSSAYYVAKDEGVVCGIEVAKRVFELAGGNVDFRILLKDYRAGSCHCKNKRRKHSCRPESDNDRSFGPSA